MALKSLTPLSLVNLSGPPSSPAAGWIYFDTTLGQVGCYSGTAWVYSAGGGGSSAIGADLTGTLPYAPSGGRLADAFAGTGVASGIGVVQHGLVLVPVYRTSAFARFASITIPAAVQVGDLMIGVWCSVSGGVASTPSGWTSIRSDTGGGTNVTKMALTYKFAAGGDVGGSTSLTFGTSGGDFNNALYVATGTLSTSAALNVNGATGSSVNGTTLTAPSVTTTVAAALIVEFFGGELAVSGTPAITGPSTVRVASTGGTFNAVTISEQTQASAGASGTSTATSTSTSWVATTLGLVGSPGIANMSVDIAGGTVLVGTSAVSVPATVGLAIATADPTNPRYDIVSVGATGVPTVTTGTAAASPVWPTIPANCAALAVVAVPAATTAILTANITDLRVILPTPVASVVQIPDYPFLRMAYH